MAGLQLMEPSSALAGSGVTATATSAAQNHTADLITLSVLIADLLSALSASLTGYVPKQHVAPYCATLGF